MKEQINQSTYCIVILQVFQHVSMCILHENLHVHFDNHMYLPTHIWSFYRVLQFRILLNVYHFTPFSNKIFHVIRYVQLSDISFKISSSRNTKSKTIIYLNINYAPSSKTEAFFYVCTSRTFILSHLGAYSILFQHCQFGRSQWLLTADSSAFLYWRGSTPMKFYYSNNLLEFNLNCDVVYPVNGW